MLVPTLSGCAAVTATTRPFHPTGKCSELPQLTFAIVLHSFAGKVGVVRPIEKDREGLFNSLDISFCLDICQQEKSATPQRKILSVEDVHVVHMPSHMPSTIQNAMHTM